MFDHPRWCRISQPSTVWWRGWCWWWSFVYFKLPSWIKLARPRIAHGADLANCPEVAKFIQNHPKNQNAQKCQPKLPNLPKTDKNEKMPKNCQHVHSDWKKCQSLRNCQNSQNAEIAQKRQTCLKLQSYNHVQLVQASCNVFFHGFVSHRSMFIYTEPYSFTSNTWVFYESVRTTDPCSFVGKLSQNWMKRK